MRKFYYTLLLLAVSSSAIYSQTIIDRDPEIAAMVKEVSSDSLHSYIKTLVNFGTRNTLSTQTNPKRGIGAARKWVLQKFNEFATASNSRLTAFIDTVTYHPDGKRVDSTIILGNVIATLKGTDPNDHRVFIISGHLDNMRTNVMDRVNDAPGANDDGSGSAAVIECARIMSRHAFPATVIFVTVSGEEQGLLGAYYMAQKAKKEGWDIEAVLNNDIMGSNNSSETNIIDNTRIRVFSEGLPAYETEKQAKRIRALGLENDGKARQLARYVKEIGERYVDNIQVVMIYRNDRFLRGGDHLPYVENGFAAVRFTEMNENYYHQHQDVRKENGIQYGDLPEFMDYEYLRKNTAINLANLANLAKAPAMPQNVTVEVKKLSNYTSLHWDKPATGNVKGYYILMRETTSAFWQKKLFTTATSADLPYSKDNYFFAVQSVGEAGNESLPVVPGIEGR
ncbi:MAG: M20/M25/M40 family metallo-hydrolase [Hydrotalea flava]|nr:M20/M25/M40 family metallo-hydrolase [Hydrotalea flava]NIM37876.1 M20/M25/M40 family metallo-hydrolase [Hydrotalea flava]NIN03045.1 M20/M25/M40 family metallo-hydrolase [Hydrotalea flava]NIN14730.1 M20/M25/M40 family metallo-hydrolase [Hydrotalea flava]NIO93802.1 M20/M25/M40 family metallo-hydrolase [Hydrotalea flava]